MIEFETLLPVLGMPLRSSAVDRLVNQVGQSPELEATDEKRSYATFPSLGFDLVLDNGVISTLQLFGEAAEPGQSPYRGTMPHGLSFDDSRAMVVKRLGPPLRSHAGRDDPRPFVRIEPWVRYSFGKYSVHCNFSMDAARTKLISVQLVSA